MPNAQVVASWTEAGQACMAVRVNEGAPFGVREYIGRLAADDAWQALASAQKRAALVAACKATRDASTAPPAVDLGIAGGQVAI